MKKKKQAQKKLIVIQYCNSWTSSSARTISAVGKAASATALKQAAEAGICTYHLEDGVIVSSDSIAQTHK